MEALLLCNLHNLYLKISLIFLLLYSWTNIQNQILEKIFHNLIVKRESNINLDFSKCNLMSILNFTPDSFFNPSRVETLENLRKKIEKLHLQKVDIVDIGAESSRPGAKKITYEEEIRRLKLFFDNIDVSQLNLKLSLDSRNFKTISSFINNGILIIEDPSLLECLKKNSYDQFYDEHAHLFSLLAISRTKSPFLNFTIFLTFSIFCQKFAYSSTL